MPGFPRTNLLFPAALAACFADFFQGSNLTCTRKDMLRKSFLHQSTIWQTLSCYAFETKFNQTTQWVLVCIESRCGSEKSCIVSGFFPHQLFFNQQFRGIWHCLNSFQDFQLDSNNTAMLTTSPSFFKF